jgi:hypothetical protein
MNYDQNDCQQFYFITPRFSDTHTKNKSWRRCRLYFRGRMQCWWIFDFETNYRPLGFYSPALNHRQIFLHISSFTSFLKIQNSYLRYKGEKLSFIARTDLNTTEVRGSILKDVTYLCLTTFYL